MKTLISILTLSSLFIAAPAFAQEEPENGSNPDTVARQAQPTAVQPPQEGLKAFSKFDFIPGEQVIFFDDFSQDNIGDFPALWNTNSSGEVVTFNTIPGKWLKMQPDGYFVPDLKNKMPENFTVEYDLVYSYTNVGDAPDFGIAIISKTEGDLINSLVPGNGGCEFRMNPYSVSTIDWKEGVYGENNKSVDNSYLQEKNNQVTRISIAVQKERVRIYVDQEKVFDVPRMLYKGMVYDWIRFYSGSQAEGYTPYIGNFRVAVGATDMRSKLITEGKLVTRGIMFDSGSDRIKPESYGTLKMIAGILKDNAAVRVRITGHTDSDGDEQLNLDLSKRRAASVKNALSGEFGIDSSRMDIDGKGESEPVDSNATPEGKANNRRVEFVKL
jgi:OmpA-OmpF porin, OOP family